MIRSRARQIQEAIVKGSSVELEPEQRDLRLEEDWLEVCDTARVAANMGRGKEE
jgi:hypothetical protein